MSFTISNFPVKFVPSFQHYLSKIGEGESHCLDTNQGGAGDDPAACVCVCVRRHGMPASQRASRILVIGRGLLCIADVSIVIGFPVSIQGTALYLLGVWVAMPLGWGRFRAFYGASAPSPVWPDIRLADGCRVSVI